MTRADIQAQILDDLKRTDMTDAASSAISSAISHYETEKWWFLETTSIITATASQGSYTLTSTYLNNDSVLVTVSSQYEPLTQRGFHEINEKDSGAIYGTPDQYCFYGNLIRLYPVPDKTYNITLSGDVKLETTATASNSWTNIANNLIRHKAVKEIYASKLLDENNAAMAEKQELQEYSKLRTTHLLRTTRGKIRKTEW